jgi:UDP-glucose 4-epimerase
MTTWVVGQGGLLGHALASQSERLFSPTPVPWHDYSSARTTLTRDYAEFRSAARDGEWLLAWAAGAATVAQGGGDSELALLTAVLECVRLNPPAGPGVVFLASSAGGVYAGGQSSPYDSLSTPQPVSAYGRLKLRQEQAATEALRGVAPLVIGRLANLYGHRQDRSKPQGLVTRLCLSSLHRRPMSIFVPLQTQRDWIDVDDAARAALGLCAQARGGEPRARIHVIATGVPTTVGRLIRIVEGVTHRRVPITFGIDASAADQPFDLRLNPGVTVLRAMGTQVPLPCGVRRLYDHLAVNE